MARDFDFGAELTSGGGAVFKNPEVGDHEAIITAIVHVGSFEDHFKKGGKVDIKKPCNYVLVRATLMGDQDFNEDGSRMEQWNAIALKQGDKASLTAFMDAVDPKEQLSGFDEVIGKPLMVKMVGSKETNDDGTPKYVNWAGKGFAGVPARLAAMIEADVKENPVDVIGHVKFDQLTFDVLDAIPAHIVRQYFLNEGATGSKNLSVPGSHVATIIAKARKDDAEWKLKKADEQEATPDNRESLDTGSQSVPEPEAENIPAPDLDAEQEY